VRRLGVWQSADIHGIKKSEHAASAAAAAADEDEGDDGLEFQLKWVGYPDVIWFNAAAHLQSMKPLASSTPLPSGGGGDANWDEFPEDRMDLPLLRAVLDKIPALSTLRLWASGDKNVDEKGVRLDVDAEGVSSSSSSSRSSTNKKQREGGGVSSLNKAATDQSLVPDFIPSSTQLGGTKFGYTYKKGEFGFGFYKIKQQGSVNGVSGGTGGDSGGSCGCDEGLVSALADGGSSSSSSSSGGGGADAGSAQEVGGDRSTREGGSSSSSSSLPSGGDVLRRKLDQLDDLIFPLLRWLLTSNRKSHLRALRPSERFESLGPLSHQFALLSGPIERETAFQRMKRAHGSLFAWHGSGSGNWHAILRTSLQNMSNTKHMSTGAAYGKGIYFATDSVTSIAYCRNVQGGRLVPSKFGTDCWPNSMFGRSLTCLALCEIINKKEDFTLHPGSLLPGGRGGVGSGYYVVPHEEYVTTRFFIVNPQSTVNENSETIVTEATKQGKFQFL